MRTRSDRFVAAVLNKMKCFLDFGLDSFDCEVECTFELFEGKQQEIKATLDHISSPVQRTES